MEKPIKPKLGEFALDEQKVKCLVDFKGKCKRKTKIFQWIIFALFSIIGIYGVLPFDFDFIFLYLIFSAILTWGIIPFLFNSITKREFNNLIYEKTKSSLINIIDQNNNSFTLEMNLYKSKNELYERVIRRSSWEYWLSLNPTDFEVAVGDLFLDKGYEVWTTRASGDHGVDLHLEKEGKKFVVQCKTYKKTLGPNVARDLYGTMTAQGADKAFLVAPSGFSQATKEFCNDKPIILLDIDELTKMTYDFENYIPYWIDNAKSMDDVIRGINKHVDGGVRGLRGNNYKRKRY